MICVSIARGRHKQVKAEHRHLVEQGACLVELRLDYLRREINLKRLLRDRPSPVVATCRREQDQGKWAGTEEARLMLLRSAIAEGVEYIDLEEDVAGGIPRYGQTKRIISYHNFRETPENLEEIHERLVSLDADIVKLSTMANSTHDNVRMLRLVENADAPTIGFCMGEIGTPSRILAGKYGAPFTYATFHHERTLAPGQLSFEEMHNTYHYDRIDRETEVYGVIADPIGHSLSPLVHNACFRELNMNAVYVPFRVPREQLRGFLDDCRDLSVKGLSVTIPHKEAMLRHLTKVDYSADQIGAVNTVVFQDDETVGYNTDHRAAVNAMVRATGVKERDNPLDGKTVLVMGAGGVARAIVFGLRRKDAKVIIVSRSLGQANELADRFDCKAVDWNARYTVNPDILVNATPVGMHPHVDDSPFDKEKLRRNTIVFDAVYNPEQTLLIKTAKEKGCRVITGVDMFVRQAAMQFKLFTNQDAPKDCMRNEVKRATGAAKF